MSAEDVPPSKSWRGNKREKGRYRLVSTRLHNDEWYRSLSPSLPSAQHLWHHLLTCPESTFIPGLMKLGQLQLSELLGWPVRAGAPWPETKRKRFEELFTKRLPKPFQQGFLEAFPIGLEEAFDELRRNGRANADWEACVVWLPNAVRHDPPANPNMILGWEDYFRNELPDCDLKWRALLEIAESVLELRDGAPTFLAAFERAFPELRDGLSKRLPKPFPKPFAERLPKSVPSTQNPEPSTHQQNVDEERAGKSSRAAKPKLEVVETSADAKKGEGGECEQLAAETWREVLALLEEGGKNYALTWIRRCKPLSLTSDALELAVCDKFFRDWATDHYETLLLEALEKLDGPQHVRWTIREDLFAIEATPVDEPQTLPDFVEWVQRLRVSCDDEREELPHPDKLKAFWEAAEAKGVTSDPRKLQSSYMMFRVIPQLSASGYPLRLYISSPAYWLDRICSPSELRRRLKAAERVAQRSA